MSMINTSSLRTFDSHSVCTAPSISSWLSDVINNDRFFSEHAELRILKEYAGVTLRHEPHENLPSWLRDIDGQLGVIFRESLEKHHNGEDAIPFTALCLIESDGKPFIDPWVQRHGSEDWLSALFDTVLLPVWHLLVHHGIALEAHAQNLILEHQQGKPVRAVLRDFHDSLEYVPSYLKAPEKTPDFNALNTSYHNAPDDKYYWMSDIEALRELFIDTVFVFNIADLAVLFEEHYQFKEQRFWCLVQDTFRRYAKADYTTQSRLKAMDIYQARIQTESLMKKKLQRDFSAEFHHTISNPLHSL